MTEETPTTQPEEQPTIQAEFGVSLPEGTTPATREAVIERIKMVEDPELMIDVYNLGLIYKLDIHDNGNVDIDMTLTSPMCPLAGEMPYMVAHAVGTGEGVGVVKVRLVWEPAWSLDRLSDDIKLSLGM